MVLSQAIAVSAFCQQGPGSSLSTGEIVVTAQKREQAINSVGMTIVATSAETLSARGVTDTSDLAKVVSGFTATDSGFLTPVYTLRGIGLFDSGFGSTPSVAVYVDQIPLPFPLSQRGAALDLERVEILKGPQGTLFGQSATGGAINYIAAKPTSTLATGAEITYERFGKVDLAAFVSGPLSDNLKGRVAARVVQGGAWQYSVSRPDDKNGDSDQLFGRVLLDWEPSDRLKITINANGWRDKSEIPASQFVGNQLNILATPDPRNPYYIIDAEAFAAINNPASPNYDASFPTRQSIVFDRAASGEPGSTALLAGPNGDGSSLADNSRQADWNEDRPPASDEYFYEFSSQANLRLSGNLDLVSLTSYQKTKIDRVGDLDGTTASALQTNMRGHIETFFQELRLGYTTDTINWTLGANYDSSKIYDEGYFDIWDLSLNEGLPGLRIRNVTNTLDQKIKNYSAFSQVEYKISDNFAAEGGIRYTKSKRTAAFCGANDEAGRKLIGNSDIVPGFGFYDLQTAFGLDPAGHIVVEEGECSQLNNLVAPGDPRFLRPVIDPYEQTLKEDNISFRLGATYKTTDGTLLYATVSQGYKSGIISNISSSALSQLLPAKQEKVVSYEAGIKIPLREIRTQVNLSGFYYDYQDKQLRARVRDPIFGLIDLLVNVPKSYIWGLEGEVTTSPFSNFDLYISATYLKSMVSGSFSESFGRIVYNQAGFTGDFKGSRLPYTPRLSAIVDGNYKIPISQSSNLFFGGTLTYSSRDNVTFDNDIIDGSDFYRRKHALVDVRAGISADEGKWKLSMFVRNITNKFYETAYFSGVDAGTRNVNKPRTFGVTLSMRMN